MKKKFLAFFLVLALAAGAAAGVWWLLLREPPSGGLTLYGNVEIRDALLTFNEQEIVARVLVEEGDRVEAGQLLAELRADKLREQLAEAEAIRQAQVQVLRRLEKGSRDQEIARARAEVAAIENRLANARANLRRLEKTIDIGASSEQALDDARTQLAVEQAQLEVRQQNLDLVLEGPRREDIDQAKAQLEAAIARVALLRARLADTKLRAPARGVIQSRILEPGELAGPARPAFLLALTEPKWIRTYVAEKDLGLIKPGLSVRVTSDTWPDRTFAGQIGFISPVAEFTPKTVETPDLRTKLVYEVRVPVEDPDDTLRLGMPVSVTIEKARVKGQ